MSSGGVTMVAVGGHIGDMDLAAGPVLAQNVLAGGRSILLALTPGERGHPRLSVPEYAAQKLSEGRAFADAIGAEFYCWEDQSDGFLVHDEALAQRLALTLRRWRPDVLIAHWHHSMHPDHENASRLAVRARLLSGLPGWHTDGEDPEHQRHGIPHLLFAENWEDEEGFRPTTHVPVSADAHERWRGAIEGEAFARGETYGFRYVDYYTAQQVMRGCKAYAEFAVAFATEWPYFTEPARFVTT